MDNETITATIQQYFLQEQNLVVDEFDIRFLQDEESRLDYLKCEYGIQRGDHIIVQEKTGTRHKKPSRFKAKQLDGSWGFYGWYELDSDPPTYKIIQEWEWTGRKWKGLVVAG